MVQQQSADLSILTEPNKRYRRHNPLWPTLQTPSVRARPATNDIWAAIVFIGFTIRFLYKGYTTQFVFSQLAKDRFDGEEYLQYELAACRPSLWITVGLVILCFTVSLLSQVFTAVAPAAFYKIACCVIVLPVWVISWPSISGFFFFFTRTADFRGNRSGYRMKDDEMPVLIFLIIYSLLVALLYWSISGSKQRSFASLTSKASLQFKSLQVFDLVSILLTALFVWYSFGVVVLADNSSSSANSSTSSSWLGVLVWVVHMLWFGSVTNNVTKAYATGIAARAYLGMHEEEEEPRGVADNNNAARHQQRGNGTRIELDSFISALKAFGTICFGSLVTALASVLHFFFTLATEADSDDNVFVLIFKALVRTIATLMKNWVQRFNRYALTYAVATGESYLKSTEKASKIMDHYPALERAVWGHSSAQSFLIGWLGATATGGAVFALGFGPGAVLPAALASFWVTHASSSSSNEGIPTAQFICRSEKRLYLEKAQSEYAPHLDNDGVNRERVLDMIEEFEVIEAEKIAKKKKNQ